MLVCLPKHTWEPTVLGTEHFSVQGNVEGGHPREGRAREVSVGSELERNGEHGLVQTRWW